MTVENRRRRSVWDWTNTLTLLGILGALVMYGVKGVEFVTRQTDFTSRMAVHLCTLEVVVKVVANKQSCLDDFYPPSHAE